MRLDEDITRKHPIYKAVNLAKTLNNTTQNKSEPAWKGPFEPEPVSTLTRTPLNVRTKAQL